MTENTDMITKITQLVLEQCDEHKVTTVDPSMQFADLGFDWLASIQLVMAVEEQFGIVIDDQEAQEFVSIQAVVAYLHARNIRV